MGTSVLRVKAAVARRSSRLPKTFLATEVSSGQKCCLRSLCCGHICSKCVGRLIRAPFGSCQQAHLLRWNTDRRARASQLILPTTRSADICRISFGWLATSTGNACRVVPVVSPSAMTPVDVGDWLYLTLSCLLVSSFLSLCSIARCTANIQ